MRADHNEPVRLKDYRPSDYLVDTVDLDIVLHPTATRIRATLALRSNPAGRPGAPLALDGDDLVCSAASLDGVPLDLAEVTTADRLLIAAPPARPFTLSVETRVDPSANTRLMGLYRSGSAYCTQCEAEGFRRITYMLDRPDVMAVYTTRIEAERAEAAVLLGNGNPVQAGEVTGTTRHFAVWHDPYPKPAYLFAVVAGNLGAIHDRFTTSGGRAVALGIYTEPGKEADARYAMDALKRSMIWDEQVFGRAYDLDVFNIVAVSDFNMGAMENKGLNVFNDKYILASPATATDGDYAGIETVVAHEYFHNWTGNRITCRDWFQLCLKEGLTVFRDQEFGADQRSRAVKRIADVRTLRARQFPEDAGPLAHPVRPAAYREINNFYTATVYEKGAEVIRMLRRLIGPAPFAAGMAAYFERYDGTAATVEQFIGCFEEASNTDLAPFLTWYDQAGTPTVQAGVSRDRAARTLRFDLSQAMLPTAGQPDKSPQVIPIAFALVGAGGPLAPADLVADGLTDEERDTGRLVLSHARRTVTFHDVPDPCVPSLLRDFSAPVVLHSTLGDADRMFLLAHDTDSFTRWEAAQTCVTRLIVLRQGAGASAEPQADVTLRAALASVLGQAHADPAFAAQVFAWPTVGDIAREVGAEVDPDAIHAARDTLRRSVGEGLAEPMAALYGALSEPRPFVPDAASAGRRALRGALLGFLAAADRERGEALVAAQFQGADNMTDRMAALAVACALPLRNRDGLLGALLERFGSNPLVVDKWLAAEAGIPEPATLDRVRRLLDHPAFSLGNPNRVYSLIGGFGANTVAFNRADGAGYALVAQVAVQVDGGNPQVAARLMNSFRAWRTMEPRRRALAEAALRDTAARPGLSQDIRDIVDRSLG